MVEELLLQVDHVEDLKVVAVAVVEHMDLAEVLCMGLVQYCVVVGCQEPEMEQHLEPEHSGS